MDIQNSHNLIIRSKTGVYICDYKTKLESQMKLISPNGNCGLYLEKDYLIIQEKKTLTIHDYDQIVKQIDCNNLFNVHISNTTKFIVTIDKQDVFLMNLLSFPNLQIIQSFQLKSYKKELWPLIKFSSDDAYFYMIQQQQLICYETQQFTKVYSTEIGNCDYFSIQPSHKPTIICYSLQDFNVKEAYLRVIDYKGKQKYEKKLQKTSELEVFWSPDGLQVLIQKGYHEDNTGQSYFGNNQVLQFDLQKNTLNELPTYEGPVHHVQWSPKSTEFILLSGYMPSGAVMYDKNGKPLFEFGKDHKNKIIWSPNQRFVMICGFGNLDGSIHVWDAVTRKIISSTKYKSASLCTWSPCGRYYVCAKVTPRMNVDNQYSVFNYHGEEIVCLKFGELYDVQFRPSNFKLDDRPPSPHVQQKQNEQPKKIFQAFADNPLAQQMRAIKATEGARVLQINEKFGKQELPKAQNNNYPPGYIPPPEKKKRVRNKKTKEMKDEQD